MNVIRKSVIRSIFMLAVCIIGLGFIFGKKDVVEIPMPDQIMIYKNGVSYEVSPDSEEFSTIYGWCDEIRKQNTMESAVDEECIREIKSRISLEYMYLETKIMKMDSFEREFSKLLFDFEGQDNVILYDSGYKSGTYKLNINKLLMKNRLQRIVGKL